MTLVLLCKDLWDPQKKNEKASPKPRSLRCFMARIVLLERKIMSKEAAIYVRCKILLAQCDSKNQTLALNWPTEAKTPCQPDRQTCNNHEHLHMVTTRSKHHKRVGFKVQSSSMAFIWGQFSPTFSCFQPPKGLRTPESELDKQPPVSTSQPGKKKNKRSFWGDYRGMLEARVWCCWMIYSF